MSQKPPYDAPLPPNPPAAPVPAVSRVGKFGHYGGDVPIEMDVLEILQHSHELGSGGRPIAFQRAYLEIKQLRALRDRQTIELNAEVERRRVAENAIQAAAEAIKR